jgi:prophage tail gpP-like protein
VSLRLQHGQATGLGSLMNVAIDPVSDLARAFVLVLGAGHGLLVAAGPATWAIRGRMTAVDQVRFEKNSAATDGAASWTVVEATEEEFTVQHLTGLIGQTMASVEVTLPTPVDPARSMIVASVQVNGPVALADSHAGICRWRFTEGGAKVQVVRGYAHPTYRTPFSLQVIEWAADLGVTVTHLQQALSGDLSSPVLVAHGLPGLVRARTLCLASLSHGTGSLEGCGVAVHLPDGTHVSYEREATTSSLSSTAEVQLVQFPVERGVVVQHAKAAVGGPASQALIVPGASWSPTDALGFLTAACAGTTNFPRGAWRLEVTSSTQLTARRGFAGQASTIAAWVADFSGWTLPVEPPSGLVPFAALPDSPPAGGGLVAGVLDLPSSPSPAGDPLGGSADDRQPRGISREATESEALAAGDRILVELDGTAYAGWTRARVSRSIEAAAGTFELEATSRDGWPIGRGAEVIVGLKDRTAARGFVDSVEVSIDADAHSVRIAGRDQTADLVDCSAPTKQGEWYFASLSEIVAEIADTYGVFVDTETEVGPVFDKFSVQPGETAWEAIERACRLRGVLATGDGRGGLVLIQPGTIRAEVALVWGRNVLGVQYIADDSERFAEYTVRGQQPGNDEIEPEASAFSEGKAFDDGARVGRRLLVIAEGAVDDQQAKDRAEWEAAVRAARAVQLRILVRGWRQTPGGRLWSPNLVVPVSIPPVQVDGDLLTRAVTLTYDESGGHLAELELVRLDAYQRQPTVPQDTLDGAWSELDGVGSAEDGS